MTTSTNKFQHHARGLGLPRHVVRVVGDRDGDLVSDPLGAADGGPTFLFPPAQRGTITT
jgi:hypothetical protein